MLIPVMQTGLHRRRKVAAHKALDIVGLVEIVTAIISSIKYRNRSPLHGDDLLWEHPAFCSKCAS